MIKNITASNHLDFYSVEKFEKFLNPSKSDTKREQWKKDLDGVFSKFLGTGVNMPLYMKLHFAVFLMLYPMKSNEEKTFFGLNENQRVGYLNKFMIKKSRTCKVPSAVINRYEIAKSNYNRQKRFASSNVTHERKMEMTKYTYLILEICYDNNTRNGKLDALLGD